MPDAIDRIDANLDGIGHLISDKRIETPPYQRSFAWEKDQVTDLLRDIGDAIRANAPEYFLGQDIDRPLIEELFTLEFLGEAANAVLIGPNGLGKSMIAKNLTHLAVVRGHTARFTTASDMLHDLAAQDSDASLARRLRRYTQPTVLCIDEVGYLSYDNRYADLLFEVVTRRYQHRSIVLTTNRPFGEWNDVFPNAACVVTLIDRLVHRAEITSIAGESYRLKEAKERAQNKAKKRSARRPKTKSN